MRILSVLIIILLTSLPAQAAIDNYTSARQAIMIDYETGMALIEKDADQRMPTSSMSKVMTVIMVFEALKEGRLTLDGELPVSEKAWRKGGSKMFVEVGTRVKVEDLIRGVVVQSGNDATIVLAEGLAGSEEAFAAAMTARAHELGMKNTHFANASGWPDPDHYSSARDLAIMAHYLIKTFPEYYRYFSETEFTYNNIKQSNRNPLLYRDMGADGVKTGHTEDGGYGLIGSGERDGRRVILVVNGIEDNKARSQESARLLEWGLKGFENRTLFAADETVVSVPVVMGSQEEVPLITNQDIRLSIPTVSRDEMKVEAVYNAPVQAPVYRGTEVGMLKISMPNGQMIETPLMAARNVPALGFLAQTIAKAKLILSGGK